VEIYCHLVESCSQTTQKNPQKFTKNPQKTLKKTKKTANPAYCLINPKNPQNLTKPLD
jgi:hypothetical protein